MARWIVAVTMDYEYEVEAEDEEEAIREALEEGNNDGSALSVEIGDVWREDEVL